MEASWVDQDHGLLRHLKEFLWRNEISSRLAGTWTQGRKYFELSVMESDNLLKLLERMSRLVDKKQSQVPAAVAYLENRITAEDFISVMNDAVRAGRRSSTIKHVGRPFTKEGGLHRAKTYRPPRRRSITPEMLAAMRKGRVA